MKKYAARRDDNEPIIVAALEIVGAAVQRLDPPLPDLLVSYQGVLHLIEIKRVRDDHATVVRGRAGNPEGLTPSQERWWRAWRGKLPVVVHDVDEALRAIGARVNLTPAGSDSPGGGAAAQPPSRPR
jgi:hypothetical protein